MIENVAQRKIIGALMVNDLSFNQLWDRKEDSNKLAYHIRRLESLGYISKVNGKYALTKQGRALSAFISVEGKSTKFPVAVHVTIIRSGSKFLCQERLKEPFRGYWSFVSGPVRFGKSLFDCCKDDVKLQTGLVVKSLRQKGVEDVITFDREEVLYHHLVYGIEAVAEGKLLDSVIGKRNVWLAKKQLLEKKIFPKIAFDEYLDPKVNLVIAEGQRFMENGAFTGVRVIRKVLF